MCEEFIQAFLTFPMTGTGDIVIKKKDYCPKLSQILVRRKTTYN